MLLQLAQTVSRYSPHIVAGSEHGRSAHGTIKAYGCEKCPCLNCCHLLHWDVHSLAFLTSQFGCHTCLQLKVNGVSHVEIVGLLIGKCLDKMVVRELFIFRILHIVVPQSIPSYGISPWESSTLQHSSSSSILLTKRYFFHLGGSSSASSIFALLNPTGILMVCLISLTPQWNHFQHWQPQPAQGSPAEDEHPHHFRASPLSGAAQGGLSRHHLRTMVVQPIFTHYPK